MLRVDTKTWTRDSHDLYDYEAQQVNKRSFLISASVSFFRNRAHVTCVQNTVNRFPDTRQDLLFSIVSYEKSGKREYVISPADSSTSETYNIKKLWIIVKELHLGYHVLQMDDIIKLGRFRLKVRHLSLDIDDFKFAKLSDNEPKEMQDIPLRDSVQCRICLTEGDSEEDPLICPCECKGSIKYAHFLCLQKWVCGRTDMEAEVRSGNGAVFIRDMCCELCKAEFPRSIKKNNRVMHFIKVPPSLFPFVVLDSLSYSNVKGLHILSFANKVQLKIGRGHECDLRIPDVSISRLHATIRFVDGEFRLEDQGSKFGTLIAIRRAIILNDGTPFIFQVGRSIIELEVNLQEPFRNGVVEIIEDMQVLDTPQTNNELQVLDDDPEGTTQTNRVTRNQRISSNVNVPNETIDSDDVILLEERVVSPPIEEQEDLTRRNRRGRNSRTSRVNAANPSNSSNPSNLSNLSNLSNPSNPSQDYLFQFGGRHHGHRVEIVELDFYSSENNQENDDEIIGNLRRYTTRRNDHNDRGGNGNISRRNTNSGNRNENNNRNRNESQNENSSRSRNRNRNRNTNNTERQAGNNEVIVLDSDTNEATNAPRSNMRGEFRFRRFFDMIATFPYRSRNANRMEPPSGSMQIQDSSNNHTYGIRENNSRVEDTYGDQHESNEDITDRINRNLLCLPEIQQGTEANNGVLQRDFADAFRTAVNPMMSPVVSPTGEDERRNREVPASNNPQLTQINVERGEGNRVERPRRGRRPRTLMERMRNRAMELAERQFNTMRNDLMHDAMFRYTETNRGTTAQNNMVSNDRNNTTAGNERTGTRRTAQRSGRNSRPVVQRNTQRNSRRNTQGNVTRNTERSTRRTTQGNNERNVERTTERTNDRIMERDIRRNIEANVLRNNNRTNELFNNERNVQRNEGMNISGRNPMERVTSIIVPEPNDLGVLRIIRAERNFTLDLGNTSQTRELEEAISVEGEFQEREQEDHESVKDMQVTRDDTGETISETDQRRNRRSAFNGNRERQPERNHQVDNEGHNERDTQKKEEDSEEDSEGDSDVIVVRGRKDDDDDEHNNDGTGTNNAEGNRRTSLEGRREPGIMSGRRNRENISHSRNHETSRTLNENNQNSRENNRCTCIFCSDKNLERETNILLGDLRNTVNETLCRSAGTFRVLETPTGVINGCTQIQNGELNSASDRVVLDDIEKHIGEDLQTIRELSDAPREFLKRKITEIERMTIQGVVGNNGAITTEVNDSKRPKVNGTNERSNNNANVIPLTETNRVVEQQGEFATFLFKKVFETLDEHLSSRNLAAKQMLEVLKFFKHIVETFTKETVITEMISYAENNEKHCCNERNCIIRKEEGTSSHDGNNVGNEKTGTNQDNTNRQGEEKPTVSFRSRRIKTKAEMINELFSDLIIALNTDHKGLHEHVKNMKKRLAEDGIDYETYHFRESENRQDMEEPASENDVDEMMYRENDLYASDDHDNDDDDDDSFTSVRSREVETRSAQQENNQNKNKEQNVLRNVEDAVITVENTPIKKNSNITETNTEQK